MSITTVTNPLGPITNITGDDLAWLAECMEYQARDLADHAELLEGEAQAATNRNADDAEEYEWRATVKREEHARTVALAEMLATATQVDVMTEVAA